MFIHNDGRSEASAANTAVAKAGGKMCRSLLLLFAVLAAGSAQAFENGSRFEVETGGIWQSRNDAQSPARATATMPQGTRFSLKALQGTGPSFFARLSAAYTWDDKHQVHALYAPLTITGSGTFQNPVSFQGQSFAANTPTDGRYRFDSYRIGYRYKVYDSDDWHIWGGVTVKVRDANISLSQGALKANRANTGPVPLLSLYARRDMGDRWSAIVDVEGLAAPQGRAVDAAFKIRHQLSNGVGVSAGYRMLEGGADNKKVYTFAWVHYGLLALDYKF
jgi:hypothetical protein